MATIRIRRSTTAGAVPSSLVTGEVAINEADGALYYRTSSGAVARFLSPQQGIVYASQATSALVGRTVLLTNSSSTTVTLDADSSIPNGSTIYFVRTGAGAVLFNSGAGGTVYASPHNTLSAQYTAALAVKISTTDWALTVLSTAAAGGYTTNPFSSDSLFNTAQAMLSSGQSTPTSASGNLLINSLPLGNMDYVVKQGNQTISAFTDTDWFTSTQDTASAWVVVNGSLTVNSGQIVIPPARKLFTVFYINGNLVLNGSLSMSLRGANHSGTGTSGGATTARDIRIINGTWGSYTNPTVPATGGAAGTALTAGLAGQTATFGTGGGGAGTGTFGASGASGTAFCGGAGGGAGGGLLGQSGSGGGANGGAGGNGNTGPGGAGNPAGTPTVSGTESGSGGTLIIFVKGSVTGNGTMTSRGGNSVGTGYSGGSGASGGGVAVLLSTTALSGPPTVSPTFSVTGGTSTGATTTQGGAGGAGFSVNLSGL